MNLIHSFVFRIAVIAQHWLLRHGATMDSPLFRLAASARWWAR